MGIFSFAFKIFVYGSAATYWIGRNPVFFSNLSNYAAIQVEKIGKENGFDDINDYLEAMKKNKFFVFSDCTCSFNNLLNIGGINAAGNCNGKK